MICLDSSLGLKTILYTNSFNVFFENNQSLDQSL